MSTLQEWFSSEWLYSHVKRNVHTDDSDATAGFQQEILDSVPWERALLLLAERTAHYGQDNETRTLGENLVRWALPIDPLFAAKLVKEGAPQVWDGIGQDCSATIMRLP